jgi:2-keto-4-pentenoate hydratase
MLVENKLRNGERIIGWKVGATSRAVMDQLEIDEPIFGRMTSGSEYSPSREVPATDFCCLAVEGEIAFVMQEPLKGPGISDSDVIPATSGIMGAVELVDCRIRDRKITTSEAAADNALHAGVILGPVTRPIEGFDLSGEGVMMTKNGRFLASASGAEALGNPVSVVVWLANKLAQFDLEIRAGEIILTGSLTRFFRLEPEDVVDVSFSSLGRIHFTVS